MSPDACRTGPPAARESYLRSDNILAVARSAGADAVHPGYGFLSENAAFAEACAAAGVRFVGPPADAIRAMGDKARAKEIMSAAGVPVVPGYHGADQDEARWVHGFGPYEKRDQTWVQPPKRRFDVHLPLFLIASAWTIRVVVCCSEMPQLFRPKCTWGTTLHLDDHTCECCAGLSVCHLIHAATIS